MESQSKLRKWKAHTISKVVTMKRILIVLIEKARVCCFYLSKGIHRLKDKQNRTLLNSLWGKHHRMPLKWKENLEFFLLRFAH